MSGPLQTILPPAETKPAAVAAQRESQRCDPQIITATAVAIIAVMFTVSARYIFEWDFFSKKIFSILETSQVIYLTIGILTVGYISLKIKKNFTSEVPELDIEPTAKRKPDLGVGAPVSIFPSLVETNTVYPSESEYSAPSRVIGAYESPSFFWGGGRWTDLLPSFAFGSSGMLDFSSIQNKNGKRAKKIDIDGSGDNNNCLLHAIFSNMKEMNKAALAKGTKDEELPWQPAAFFSNGATFSTATPEDFHIAARRLRTTIGEEGLQEWYNGGFASCTAEGQPTQEAGFYKKWSCLAKTFYSCKDFLDKTNTAGSSQQQILANARYLRAHIDELKSLFGFISEWDDENSKWMQRNIFDSYDSNVSLWFSADGTFNVNQFQSFRDFIARFNNNLSPLVNGYHYSATDIHKYLLELRVKIPNIHKWNGQKYIENSCIWDEYDYKTWFRNEGTGTLISEHSRSFRTFTASLKDSIKNLSTLDVPLREFVSRIFTIEDERFPLYEMHFEGLDPDELRKKREWFDILVSSLAESIGVGDTQAPELAAVLIFPRQGENIPRDLLVDPAERAVKGGRANENTIINFLNGIKDRPLQLSGFSVHQLCLHFKIEIVWFKPNHAPQLVNPLKNTQKRFYIHNNTQGFSLGGHWTCIEHVDGEALYQDSLQLIGTPKQQLACIH